MRLVRLLLSTAVTNCKAAASTTTTVAFHPRHPQRRHLRCTSSSFPSATRIVAMSTSAVLDGANKKAKMTAVGTVARTALDEHGVKGEFQRKDSVWRNWIQSGAFHVSL
jgi:hypothetical protein